LFEACPVWEYVLEKRVTLDDSGISLRESSSAVEDSLVADDPRRDANETSTNPESNSLVSGSSRGFVAKFLEEATHAIKSRLSVNLG
jgi:hypothetical protein